MADLTDAQALGRGIEFDQSWDFVTSTANSMGQIDGVPILGRDLAFDIRRRMQDRLNTIVTPADRAAERERVRTVILDADRVKRIVDGPTIEEMDANDNPYQSVTIRVTVEALGGVRGEAIITV